jgi:hypothetical protein
MVLAPAIAAGDTEFLSSFSDEQAENACSFFCPRILNDLSFLRFKMLEK